MKKIIISALLVLALAFTATAATVTFDIIEGNVAGTYQIVAVMDDDEGDYRSYANTITFDSNVIVPVSKTNGNPANIAGGKVQSPLTQWSYTYYDEDEEMDVTKIATIKTAAWTAGENGLYELVFESYIDEQGLPLDGMTVFSMHFKYAEGKSEADITADTFKVDAITYADGGYNYYGRDDEGKATNVTLVNNVVPEAPVATEYWNVGNGYNLVDIAGDKVADNSPVTKSGETETSVTVKYGGYYQGTANWAGAALKEAVTVDGLEIEVTFTALPSSTDCWAYIGVLAEPSIFSTGTPYNNGYVNLIRYGKDKDQLELHGTTGWSQRNFQYGIGEGFFTLEAGDTLRVCFDKNAEGEYDITYVKNGAETFVLPTSLDLEDALGGTTGYPVVSASCKGSEEGAFKYTVNVDPDELKIAKLPVAKGDTVYEYNKDGSSYILTEIDADGTYDVLAKDDEAIIVVVNSGYTAQKVYTVSATVEGNYQEGDWLANSVLGSSDVSMRAVDPQGIRFFGSVSYYMSRACSEYGFIMTAESAYNKLPDDYVLDIDLVNAGKAKKGVAYDGEDIDKYFSKDDTKTVIAGVLHGIPMTKEGVQTVIVSRPYVIMGGGYIYGEETKSTLYDIAKELLKNEDYKDVWEYAQAVVGLVDEEETELTNEIAIDVSSLYE